MIDRFDRVHFHEVFRCIGGDRRKKMHQHRLRRTVQAIVLAGVGALIAVPAIAQTPPDNTKVNTRDRAKGATTADQQKENAGDREITRKIRRSLMSDKALSSYAHNVKVIARDGRVTLKGPVRADWRDPD